MSNPPDLKFTIQDNEEVTLARKKVYRNKDMPNYLRIGIMTAEVDVIDKIIDASKGAQQLFKKLKLFRNPGNNMATLGKPKNKSEAVNRTKAFKELETLGLVKRVKVMQLRDSQNHIVEVPLSTYLINPCMLFPKTNEDFDQVMSYWNQIGE